MLDDKETTRRVAYELGTKDAYESFREDFGLPDYKLMLYQKEMIRKAIEHILTYDTLKGLGEK